MKKLFIIAALFLVGMTAYSQDLYVYGGVTTNHHASFGQELELGGTTGKHTLAFVGETYNEKGLTFEDRQYLVGAKYTRTIATIPLGSFAGSFASKMSVNDFPNHLVVEPGIQYTFGIRNIGVRLGVVAPIEEGHKIYVRPSAGLVLVL